MDGEELGLIEDSAGGEEVAEEESGGEETAIEGETETETETEPEGEGGRAGEETEGERGARSLPVQLRKALREFAAGNPEFAKRFPRLEKQISTALIKDAQIGKLGGLQALRAASEAIEAHGGMEGLQELADSAEATRVLEQGMDEGDPVLVNMWAENSPEGFKAAGRPYLERLEQLDLAAHDYVVSPTLAKTLTRCGVFQSMNDLKTAIAGEKLDDIKRHFDALESFYNELQRFARAAKAPDPLKADRDKLALEREEMATERTKSFYGGIRSDVNTQVMAYTNRLLRQELHGRKMRVETANRLRKQINEDLAEAVNNAPGYADRYKATMNGGDHDRAVQFIVAAARQKLPMVIKRVLRDFNLSSAVAGNPRRTVSGGGARAGTSSTVAGRPKTDEVDFSRTDKATWIGSLGRHGEAWLKNGKKAKW
jgi:hypothetical protein